MRIHQRLSAFLSICLLALLLGLQADPAQAHGKTNVEPKIGILLVTFGTSVPEARKAYATIESKVKAAYPGVELRWAYTSRQIRHKVATEEGLRNASPAGALGRMLDDGFTHVAVQSLHVIPGQEFNDLTAIVAAFGSMPKSFERIVLGPPLLSGPEAMQALAKAVLASVPGLGNREALVLVGHGTHHLASAFYPAMQYYLQQESERAFVGTIESSPSMQDVLADLAKRKIAKAYLVPFLTVAGDHARNDIAGNEPDSWKSQLKAKGIACQPVMRGLAEDPAVVDIWVDQLGLSLKALRDEPKDNG
ncbi:sirohydrochlorin cobaltochelatase [Desulfocurvibacter africanus]|uniref:sirohydrochlorin cobaltochelatase n=1 Tax=Desulfocurvibacter africanus TaxID=873 RepID=UPI000411B030|nr:sirohydrochlorin cobaltochelatase [Desulfocurvibacter africanus]